MPSTGSIHYMDMASVPSMRQRARVFQELIITTGLRRPRWSAALLASTLPRAATRQAAQRVLARVAAPGSAPPANTPLLLAPQVTLSATGCAPPANTLLLARSNALTAQRAHMQNQRELQCVHSALQDSSVRRMKRRSARPVPLGGFEQRSEAPLAMNVPRAHIVVVGP